MTLVVKICGIRDPEMAHTCAEAGATAIGCVLAEGSPRTISFERACAIHAALPTSVACIAVVQGPQIVDHDLSRWPGGVQFHGSETAQQISEFATRSPRRTDRWIVKVIKGPLDDILPWDSHPLIDAILVDGDDAGSGKAHSSEWLEHLASIRPRLTKPVILAGGLTPESVGRAIELVRPDGVDVSSGVERTRGVKDPSRIVDFVIAAREAHDRLHRR